jgi:hypothetical protein
MSIQRGAEAPFFHAAEGAGMVQTSNPAHLKFKKFPTVSHEQHPSIWQDANNPALGITSLLSAAGANRRGEAAPFQIGA